MASPYYHGFTQSTQRGTLYPGQTILVNRHNVQVERYLSQGGFAHVYVVRSAVPINNNTQHVLKRIAVADSNMLKEVQKEVEVMRKLRGHPNIVDFIDASWHTLPNGGYEVFILMEFCAGGGLIDMMNRRLRERLTEMEIFQIFVDVCEAVAVMHSQTPPLLHRDLKIENILQASSTLYKLCDFGSAVPVSARHSSSVQELRELEADLGRHTTLQYRAPEMVDVYQRRHIDQKSDVWALGVLLYKLCYYTTPFEEHGPLAILNVQYRIPPYPVYSREMNTLIASMLQELGTQRPTIFELLNTVHQLRGTKSRFNYVAASQKSISLSFHPSSSSKDEFRDLITSRIPPKPVTNAISITPENIVPMRRGRPVSTLLNPSTVPPKEADAISKSKNPWLSAKPTTTQDKFDDAWLIPGTSGGQRKSQESTGAGFGDSFSANMVEKKVDPRPSPSPQPVSQVISSIPNFKSSRDAFDGLASIPQAQAPPTLGEAAQNFKSGLRVQSKPPLLRGVISRSPLPQPIQPARSPISPRMSASRTGLAAYRLPSLPVEQRYPSLEDLDRSWNPYNPAPRSSIIASVTRPELPGKITSISNPNLSNISKFSEFENDSTILGKELLRDKAPSLPTQSTSSQINPTATTSLRPPSNPPDIKKDMPIGSSPAKYRPSRPALARKRLSIQPTADDLPASIPPAPRDWLTGDDSSPTNNTTVLPKENVSTPTQTTSFKPLSSANIPTQNLNNRSLPKPSSSPTKLGLPLPSRSARTSPISDYGNSRSLEHETADDSSSDEADGPEEIATSPLKRAFRRPERRQSSVHDLVDLYGGGPRFQPSKIPSPSKQNRRTSGTLIDVSVSGSLSDFLSPSSIIPKSQAELANRHFRSRSSSPAETKPLPLNEPRKLSPKTSPISPVSNEWKDKRPQSMLLVSKPKSDSPSLLQLPAEESRPKRAGRRSSISDMVSLYENLVVVNSNQKIPPPVAQKPPALKGKTPPTQFRYPAVSPTSTSFPSKLTDPLPPPRPLPRRSSTYDYIIEDKLNIQKEAPIFLHSPNGRLSVSPVSPVSHVSPVLEPSNSIPPSNDPSNSLLRRSPSPLEPSQEPNNGISSPSPERPFQGVSHLISQWQRKSEEAEESRRNVIRGRGRPIRGRSIGHQD